MTAADFPAGGLVDVSRATYRDTPLAVTEIRPSIFAFSGAGGTVTAIGSPQGCAVIDTGYAPRVNEIRQHIARTLRQSPRWLVNTHWHFDHTDGNSTYADDGTNIIAHVNCRERLSRDQYVPSLEWRSPAAPRSAWPAVTFDAPVTIDLGPESLQLIPQEPAHTDGDVAVWLPSSNVLIMGDLFINGSYPVIDESSHGSLGGMIHASDRLLRLINAETIVVPGHGPIGNRDALLGFRDMLRTVEERIGPMIASHWPVAEVLSAAPTADFDPVWGRGYVTGPIFVRMILAALGYHKSRELDMKPVLKNVS
jgi:cyclase